MMGAMIPAKSITWNKLAITTPTIIATRCPTNRESPLKSSNEIEVGTFPVWAPRSIVYLPFVPQGKPFLLQIESVFSLTSS